MSDIFLSSVKYFGLSIFFGLVFGGLSYFYGTRNLEILIYTIASVPILAILLAIPMFLPLWKKWRMQKRGPDPRTRRNRTPD